MRNNKAKRIIAVLLCLVVFAGSELSGITNIVGDLFATEMPAQDAAEDTWENQKEEIEITGDVQPTSEEDSNGQEDHDGGSETSSDSIDDSQASAPAPSDNGDQEDAKDKEDVSDDTIDNTGADGAPSDGNQNDGTDSPSSGKNQKDETDSAEPDKTQSDGAGSPESDGNQSDGTNFPESDGNQSDGTNSPESDGNQSGVMDSSESGENQNHMTDSAAPDGNQNNVMNQKLFDLDEEEDEEDVSDLPTMEEMDEVPIDQARATIQKMPALFRLARMEESEEIKEDTNENWEFSVYYQNNEDDSHVELTGDTSVKYQMEFHTDVALAPGKVEIRIPYGLFRDRDGKLVTPTEIAVPQSPTNDDIESVYNKSTPFNYYITDLDDDGNPTDGSKLVFFNYRRITAGTNAAWQVLFRNLSIMQLRDGSEWELQAEALVTKPKYEYDDEAGKLIPVYDRDEKGEIKVDDNGKPIATEHEEKVYLAPLTGVVDSSVTLLDVTKRPYVEEGDKKYTPGLYTEAQVENYIGRELPKEYADTFDDWKFVVWEVTMEGSATQPWSLVLSEALTAAGNPVGEIVGYRNHTNSTYSFAVEEGKTFAAPPDGSSTELKAEVVTDSRKMYFRSRIYVVTAYPADQVEENDSLENTLTVEMKPLDRKDDPDSKEAKAAWDYANYDWTYSGNVIGIDKVSDTTTPYDQKDYDSWLEAYSKAMDAGEDYGSLWFASTGSFKGYGNTHYVEDSTEGRIGNYIEGTGYELTTVDDFMYATPSGQGGSGKMLMLNWEDYYYSEVKVTQTDRAYDFLEDQETSELEREAEGVYLYAMYAKPETEGEEWTEEDKNTWVLVNDEAPVMLDASTATAVYTFSPEELAREPWRVKVVHESTEYKTECRIDVHVRLRAEPSDGMKTIMEDYKKDNVASVKLEDLSGVLGRTYTTDTDGKKIYTNCELSTEDDVKYGPYDGLKEATLELYKAEYPEGDERKTPIQRDNASVTVYGLRKEADAFKTYRTTNDVANSRAMVDYYLTAYDSYKVHEKDAVNYLKSMGVPTPGKNHVMFYDLLPQGMYFDPSWPVFAGRITELDRNGYYRSRTNYWEDAQVELSETEVLDNWNGTGRTMLIFHIDYTGADPAVYTDGKWLEGWGVNFRAYYEWKDMESVQKQYNISAFMPDVAKYENPAVELLGEYGTVYKDGTLPPLDKDYADFKTEGGLNSANTGDALNVLYAKCQTKENLATASKATIEKLVRADSDIFSVYNDSAYAEKGEGYTYKITVETKTGGLTDLVIFDHLEHASVERAGITTDPNQSRFPADSEELWHGTFRGVQLTGLAAKGVEPVVWYNTARNAATTGTLPEEGSSEGITLRAEEVSPDQVLIPENGWYQEADLIEKYKSEHSEEIADQTEAAIKELAFAEVKSIAVDLRKAAETENCSFELKKDDSVSFLIRMRAPETEGEESEEGNPKERYAYNNPSYYSRSTTNETGTTQAGESVRVRLGSRYTLEVIKELEGSVPESLKEQSFTFRAYRLERETGAEDEEAAEVKAPLSNKAYTLWTKTEGTEGGWTKLSGGPYAADADGYFSLQAGQKAVFENVSNAKDVVIEETESLFWNALDTKTTTKDEEKGTVTYTHTVKNQYRYVLYVQKKIEGVPEEVTLSKEERTFTFQIKLGEEPGKTQALEYCRVDGVRLDGVSSNIVPFEDGEKIRKTGEDGTFEIQEGWILALFLPAADMQYQLTELYEKDGLPLSENWMENRPVTGKSSTYGKSVIITNRYKWKDLYLTKRVTHQEAEDCHETFTFQISRWVEGTDAQAGHWEPVTSKNEWILLDSESGLEEAVEEGVETDPDQNESTGAVSGNLDENGTFSAVCAGRTIRIKKLEAGVKYQIQEINVPENYQPLQSDTVEVTMPVFSESQKAEITNDYLLRPLSVKKTVVAEGMTDGVSFSMILAKGTDSEYEVLPGQSYLIKETGETGATDENGVFSLQAGQTAVFESLGKKGEEFVVWEIQDHTEYPQIYPAGDESSVHGATVGAPIAVTLMDAGVDTQFINGSPELLLLSKEYEGGDQGGEYQVDQLKGWIAEIRQETQAMMDRVNELKIKAQNGTLRDEEIKAIWDEVNQLRTETERVISLRWSEDTDYDVRVRLTSDQEDWVLESPDHPITCIDQIIGRVYELSFDPLDGWTLWYYDEIGDQGETELPMKRQISDCDVDAILAYKDGSLNLKPWMTYVIHMGENVSYTVTEEDPYEYRPDAGYVIRQKIPEPGESLRGVTGETSAAVLYNEIKTFCRMIQKKMTVDSDPVPAGKKLVWCVQRYNESAKRWEAAEGIEYIVLEGDTDGVYDSFGGIQTTGADGKIYLSRDKGQNTILAVQFLGDEPVFLNVESAEPGTLRVIELLEESDPEWGVLAGYGSYEMGDRYGMDVSSDFASIIYNSNRTMQVEIEKQTADRVNETFTMFLKEVMTDLTGLAGAEPYQPRQGIPYTVYDSATHQEAGSGISGINGEIRMLDGQYVRLSLPSETVWAVSEDEDAVPNFTLTDLKSEKDSSGILSKKDDNLMLIGKMREGTTRITQADVHSGVINADTGERVSLSEGEVTIPRHILQGNTRYEVTGIDEYAFAGCSDLTKVEIPDSVTFIGAYAFAECTALESVKIPSGVTRIEEGTFSGCGSLNEIDIPGSVQEIGANAFWYSGLTSIEIPGSVTRIGSGAFYYCLKMTRANISEGVQSIGEYAFGVTGLTEATIPESVTNLEHCVFSECDKLKHVVFQCNVESLDGRIFHECTALERVEITGDVKRIGNDAFYGLPKLSQVTLPDSLTEIGVSAFRACSSLKSLTIPESVTVIADAAFYESGLESVTIPKNVTSLGDSVFYGCTELTEVRFACMIDSISRSMFEGCSSLEHVIVTESGKVTAIGSCAFQDLTSLSDVQLAEGLVSIGSSAFSGCSNLKNITLPESTRTIETSAFFGAGLESVTIPAGVTTLGSAVFSYNSNMRTAEVKCSVQELDQVFNNCTNLESVHISGKIGMIKWYSFINLPELKTVQITGSVEVIDGYCFMNCPALTNVSFSEGLKTVEGYAFQNCISLEEITLPGSLEWIQNYAFWNCTKLKTVTYSPGSTPQIDPWAFLGTPYWETAE